MTGDLRSIRPWGAGRHEAFEELCCQLAHAEEYPSSAKFRRKGTPDAGVECYRTLMDEGEIEHGWQAKYFGELESAQWKQLNSSVKTAPDKHPNLTRYTLCLPFDLSDARIGKKWSQLRHWDALVKKWQAWARGRGMDVEFVLWARHELMQRISHERNAGRRYFWFRDSELSRAWLNDHLQEVQARAGARYTPELHVDLPISHAFEALGQSPGFFDHLGGLFAKANQAWQRSNIQARKSVTDLIGGRLQELDDELLRLRHQLTDVQCNAIETFSLAETRDVVDRAARLAEDCAGRVENRLYESHVSSGAAEARSDIDALRRCNDRLHHLLVVLFELQDYLQESTTGLATTPFLLLLRGEAGHGKTHLLCDVARRRIENGAPTILLFGQHFKDGDPWAQIVEQLQLHCSRDELLGALDALSETSGARGLIFIDAVNESRHPEMWRDHLPAMVEVLRKYRQLGLVVSCRTSYLPLAVRDDLVPNRMICAEHPGFAAVEFEATRNFFDHYGIQRPSVPLLQPEFRNPLFLKVFCQGLRKAGLRRIPDRGSGISATFELFLTAVDDVLWQPQLLDYAKGSRIVHKAVDALAGC